MTAKNKLCRNKRGIIFGFALVIVALILLVAVFTMSTLKEAKFDYKIGGQQFKILKTHQETEKILFYVDQAAKYAAYQTITQLSETPEETKCGTYLGYPLWTNKEQEIYIECYPDTSKLENEFKNKFNENLKPYLTKKSITSGYVYYLEDKGTKFEIKGVALKPILSRIDEK